MRSLHVLHQTSWPRERRSYPRPWRRSEGLQKLRQNKIEAIKLECPEGKMGDRSRKPHDMRTWNPSSEWTRERWIVRDVTSHCKPSRLIFVISKLVLPQGLDERLRAVMVPLKWQDLEVRLDNYERLGELDFAVRTVWHQVMSDWNRQWYRKIHLGSNSLVTRGLRVQNKTSTNQMVLCSVLRDLIGRPATIARLIHESTFFRDSSPPFSDGSDNRIA